MTESLGVLAILAIPFGIAVLFMLGTIANELNRIAEVVEKRK